MGDRPDDPADALYQEDPSDFVARRAALVKSLKAEGDAERAASVAKLRKPPRTAAAVNEFARSDPGAVQALLDAARAVAESLRTGGVELRAAQSDYTSVVANLVERAADLGDITSDAMRDRMRSTLLAAGADPDGETAHLLSIGALRDDADAPGFSFGVVGPLAESGSADTPGPASDDEPARPRRRLRSVRPATASPAAASTSKSGESDAAPDPDDAGDESAELDAALRERERLAAERAEAEREATARREAMRRRRSIERDLGRLERRVSRLTEQADEAEAKATAARLAADEAVAAYEEMQARLDDT